MRRPGRRAPGRGAAHWYAVDTVRRTWVRGTWRTADDLLDAGPRPGHRPVGSDEDAEPMVLVCTHGTRDACCAVRGRPIVATLARALPDEVWECTHLGGHRFAGTLLSLPDGACFGRLDPDTAVDVVTGAPRRAAPTPRHLRGTTRWEPAVQAAPRRGARGARPGIRRRRGARASSTSTGTAPRSRCSAADPLPERVVVDVVTEALPDAPLSCGDRPKAHVAQRATVRP